MDKKPFKSHNETAFHRRQHFISPLHVEFNHNLKPYRPLSVSQQSKCDKFLTDKLIGGLKCHKDDEYGAEDEDYQTFVYAIQFCPIPVS